MKQAQVIGFNKELFKGSLQELTQMIGFHQNYQ